MRRCRLCAYGTPHSPLTGVEVRRYPTAAWVTSEQTWGAEIPRAGERRQVSPETLRMIDSTSASDQDRRKHPRLRVNLAATYRSSKVIVDTQVSDLSHTGLRLSACHLDDVGSSANVAIDLFGHHAPVAVSGKVVWREQDGSAESRGLGLHFERLTKDARLALANYLLKSSHLQVSSRPTTD